MANGLDLVESIALGSARGAKPREVGFEIVRSLEEGDLEALQSPPPVGSSAKPLISIRASHHELAKLIASGRPGAEVQLITGYSASYVSNIQNDPAFQELVEYYAVQREEIAVDLIKRASALGLGALEELQERLATGPDKFSHGQLMELIQLTLGRDVARPQGEGRSAPGGTHISINFVKAPGAEGAREVEGIVVEGGQGRE